MDLVCLLGMFRNITLVRSETTESCTLQVVEPALEQASEEHPSTSEMSAVEAVSLQLESEALLCIASNRAFSARTAATISRRRAFSLSREVECGRTTPFTTLSGSPRSD